MVLRESLYTAYEKCHIFSGAVDILVVKHEDGKLESSNWHVRLGLLQGARESKRPRKKVIVEVNDERAPFIMYLSRDGKAYLLQDGVTDDSRGSEDCAVLSPSSRQLAMLRLKEGSNKITFTLPCFKSLGQTQLMQVEARVYLWKWNARVVIVDVDGTVTKSDALGQIKSFFRQDWTQPGVVKLLSAIKENGYELLFLSARSIAQADFTRRSLQRIHQDGQQLPDGPVVVSPDRSIPAFRRELVHKTPQDFKIRCLQDISSVFPSGSEPLYAGFGNRSTDELSYERAGILERRIFTVNPKGEVMVNNQVNIESYTSLHERVHVIFPAI